MQIEYKHIVPKISLVGAGPGDPELITYKAVKAIQSADVILYDALVADELLELAPQSCLKIYVGKRSGKHSYQQSTINKMLIEYAINYGHVVRLKGGDPFVFGRGYEELEAANQNQIPIAIIPGISSAIAVPELQHIPLTHRGLSDSFQVLTATKSDGSLSKSIYDAAKSNSTIVILMGFKKLKEITTVFEQENKHNLPVAVIQNGSTNEEQIVLGRVFDIVSKVENSNFDGPTLLVFGKVVALHPSYNKIAQYDAVFSR